MSQKVSRPASPRRLEQGRRLVSFLLLLAALSLAAPELHAKGKAADPLDQADELIAAQDYNAAILYLTEFIKKYPDRFDEAQGRLRRVITIREAYNQTARALLDILVNDPTNEARKLEMIKKLETLERNPNKETEAFLQKTKVASLFVYNRSKFDEIMAKGRALIDSGKYPEAAKLYTSGFSLYRAEFDSGPYSELTKKTVSELVSGVESEVADYAAAQASLSAAVSRFQLALASGDGAAATAAWPAAEAAFVERSLRRNKVLAEGHAMAQQFVVVQKIDQTTTDSSFLPFAYRFTIGRSSSVLPEGVTGAMDSQWIALMNGVQASLEKELSSLYGSAEAAYAGGKWGEAARDFDRAAELSEPGLRALGFWSLVAPTDIYPATTQYGRAVLTGKSAAYERIRLIGAAARSSARLARIGEAVAATDSEEKAATSKGGDAATAMAAAAAFRKSYQGYASQLGAERAICDGLAQELGLWATAGLADSEATKTLSGYRTRIDEAEAGLRSRETAVVALAAGIEYSGYANAFEVRSAAVARGRELLEGAAQAQGAAEAPHYPGAAVELLGAEGTALGSFSSALAAYRERLAKETSFVAEADSVREWEAKARELLAKAAVLETERAGLLQTATDRKLAADAASREAARRSAEARAALAAGDFDTARDRLEKSRERYLASFSLEENASLRSQSDAALQQLGADIVKAENDKVVGDTRRLITQGKNAYFEGLFPKSEDALLQARARWKTTHADETNAEVEYWLRLAQSALSVKTGRDIPSTAPLYPEMSQLLSLAKKYYQEGQGLLSAKRKSEALQSFALAKDKINQIKVVFPLNQEASVLALRIDQLTDPVAFKSAFAAKYAEARTGLASNTREAYSQLQDLSAIDPGYPGLKGLLYDAEISLGLRLPPPDPAKAKRAASLVAAARSIVDSGDTGRFGFAMEQLNEAVGLDPNNAQASALRDRILTFQGGSSQIVLSSYAEEQYRQAVQQFQDGNYLQANATVERLLADAKNKRSQKILDLYKKIQARL